MNDSDSLIQTARQLLSGVRHGILSTHSKEMDGYPFGSLVPYCIDGDGWPLLLMSHLAKHSRNLLADPRCSLTVLEADQGDMQQRMRLSLVGDIHPVELEKVETERYFRYYPSSRDYYVQLNFHFFKLTPIRSYCVGGFGAARWIGIDRLQLPQLVPPAGEPELLEKIHQEYAATIDTWLQQNGIIGERSLVGVDRLGLDLVVDATQFRIPFQTTVDNTDTLIRALHQLGAATDQ